MVCILSSSPSGLDPTDARTVPQVTTQATLSDPQAHADLGDMFRFYQSFSVDELVHAVCRTAP